jgi:CelD/BcsL family acetyltransferase involved in cellulose biosynthesis
MRLAGLAAARADWTSLAERADNIFSTWEWAEIWSRHFGTEGMLEIDAVSDGDGVVAIVPIHAEQRAGLRVSRFVGHGVADQLGPVCDPSNASETMVALAGSRSHGDVLLADRMLNDRDWARELDGRVIYEDASPVIDLAQYASWESYLGDHSANFRQQVRRRTRRLARGLDVTFRLSQQPERLDADFDALLALHAARWGSDSPAFRGAREPFHREFAACALERGWLRLWLAEADGTPIAAWYGFRFGDVEYYYQAGRDSGWDRYSIGAGMLEHSIREALADGMREYRLLRGGEAYKARYATSEARLLTVAIGTRTLGRAAAAAMNLLAVSARGRHLLRLED